jgi:hypothetical protein
MRARPPSLAMRALHRQLELDLALQRQYERSLPWSHPIRAPVAVFFLEGERTCVGEVGERTPNYYRTTELSQTLYHKEF